MQVYNLVKITIDMEGKVTKEILHRDIPPIVFGKLVNNIRIQEFVGDDKNGSRPK